MFIYTYKYMFPATSYGIHYGKCWDRMKRNNIKTHLVSSDKAQGSVAEGWGDTALSNMHAGFKGECVP